jgi:hypothetical protein
MKRKDVGALREFHNDRIFESVRAVVFGELGAQASGLDADHGIKLRIEIGGAPEDFGGDLEFFDGSAGVIHGMLSQIAEQFTEGLRTMQSMAGDEPINLLEKILPFVHDVP